MKIEHKVAIIFLLALLSAGLVGMMGYINVRELRDRERSIEHTYRVLGALDKLLLRSDEAERGARRYYLTGKDAELEPYRAALDKIAPALEDLRALIQGDFSQDRRADRLQTLVNRNIFVAQQRIDFRRKNAATAAAFVLAEENERTNEEMRRVVTVMQEVEGRQLEGYARAARQTARQTVAALALPLGLIVVLLVVFYLVIRNSLRDRRRAEAALRASDGRFRGVLDSAPNAIIISTEEGEIQSANAAAERLFGFPRGEFIGRFVGSLLVENTTPTAPGAGLPLNGVRKGGALFPAELNQSALEVGAEKLLVTFVRARLEHFQPRAEAGREAAGAA